MKRVVAGGGVLVGENSYQEYLENEMALVPASPHIYIVSPTSSQVLTVESPP